MRLSNGKTVLEGITDNDINEYGQLKEAIPNSVTSIGIYIRRQLSLPVGDN